ncbi:MAG TPA: ABC transporter ATP-binding protein, partial [Anaerolineales bacterium]|nr:ABC transporter ATP-binding protein [Anaerolineales bacterium]
MSSVLQVRGLRVRRGGVPVLQIDALNLAQGEVLALVGPNGAGKTSLLLAIAQLLGRQEGEIEFLGRNVRDWDMLAYRRSLSLV